MYWNKGWLYWKIKIIVWFYYLFNSLGPETFRSYYVQVSLIYKITYKWYLYVIIVFKGDGFYVFEKNENCKNKICFIFAQSLQIIFDIF